MFVGERRLQALRGVSAAMLGKRPRRVKLLGREEQERWLGGLVDGEEMNLIT